jgi:lipoate-protein ligase A
VSLGYFQDFAAISATLPRIGGAIPPVVRRITGGGAIWHEHEVTYSLVGSLGSGGIPERVRDLYPLLHGAVLAGLRAHGTPLQRQEAPLGDRRYAQEPRCFASPAADDLVTGEGAKVLGSAARTRGKRVLVHGSLKLASNPWDGECVGGCGLGFEAAAAVIEQSVQQALGAQLEAGDFTDEEHRAQTRIHETRYSSTDWVRLRRGPRP